MLTLLRSFAPVLLAAPLMAWAVPPDAATEHVQARLVSSQASVAAGQRFTVALEQTIKPHWHTYWKNPGDSGQATSLDWSGTQAGPLQWPTPSIQAIGPIVNYGYEGRAALLVELTVPADARPGSRFQPSADVKWLVCKDVCIPEQVSLGLDLPVVASLSEAQAGPDVAQIDEWRAAIPKPAPFGVTLKAAAQGVTLAGPTAAVTKAYFFAETWGAVAHSAPQALKAEGGGWALELPAGDEPLAAGKALSGVLVLTTAAGEQAWAISAPMPEGAGKGPGPADLSATAATEAASTAAPQSELGLLPALALALLGGLILNLMPCVFPVLSIKALALVNKGNHRAEGLAYTAGVLLSFAALAGVLIALRAGGQQVGWGFQFHSPVFVLVVAYLLFLVGLNLSGLFEIGGSFTGLGSGLAARNGLTGSFFTGVLAAVVATPCTAPFMGAALAFALAQPAAVMLAVFLALGLGLALPFLVLAFWPAAQRWLPRPGAWMDTFKQALAFPMYAAVVWLLWVLAQQAGPDGVALALGGLVLMAFGLWWRHSSGASAVGTGAAVLCVVVALGASAALRPVTAPAAASAGTEAFSPERLAELRAQNQPVFVNLTAAWCISCLVNERVALSRPEVHEAFAKAGVTYLKGDWTREDPTITAVLKAHGRSGVPLYLYYAPGAAEAQVLPQILTPGLVVEAITSARRSST
ncbi:MAG: thiol:disulfide interchange protein [Methylibium sp.]|jgi:thiol:disulfide interchange protein/DsbC/DsbD-like thiol-disulfide interchange protein|uniref:Thioredoxin domain-containing protein n=7 Tax=cellular organisms TaxID=131567 RepID=A0A6V1NIK0_HETAK|nr:thiol:disulfide interchange protein [Methylibium sp.]MCH8181527.1 thioredoxin family protein [Pseudomonadota bacterium]|mmetsp:Transcript_5363/g.20350  ORF Transcript_5363/g.20350 Transcript_5363/m.20350 type:complete len:696 (+) Transcript_5363:2405-4492(+)